MIALLVWPLAAVLAVLTALAAYQWLLLAAALLGRRRENPAPPHQAAFLVLVPAHDEASTLPRTLESLAALRYPQDRVRVVVVADRCRDATAAIARRCGVECLERTGGLAGKGAAIAWALQELGDSVAHEDALVILDADTTAHPLLLDAFNEALAAGHAVQQGHNYLMNPWESPFTRLIAVSSLLRNSLFYGGKAALGLSGMLTGTGMCLARTIVERYGWTAFSVGEDWELSAALLLAGERIHFNEQARVFARESRGLGAATAQRLRWAGGRHAVAAAFAWKLVRAGFRRGQLHLLDAAVTLAAPNYSTQGTLALATLGALWALDAPAVLVGWAGLVVASVGAYFLVGAALTEAPSKTLAGLLLIPLFLPWRLAIEILGLLGYGRKGWGRALRDLEVPPKTS